MKQQGSLISHLLAEERSYSLQQRTDSTSADHKGAERPNNWGDVFGQTPTADNSRREVNPYWESIISRASGAGWVESAQRRQQEEEEAAEGAAERTVSLRGHHRTEGAASRSGTPMDHRRSGSGGVVRSRPTTPANVRRGNQARSASSSISPSVSTMAATGHGSYYMYLQQKSPARVARTVAPQDPMRYDDTASPVSSRIAPPTRSTTAVHDSPLACRLHAIQNKLANKSVEVLQEVARDDFINAQRAGDLLECCASVQQLLAIETSHRKATDDRLAERIDKLIVGGLAMRVHGSLDQALEGVEESLDLLNKRLSTISTGLGSLSRDSNAALHRFCGGDSAEATARKDELVGIFNTIGSESKARMHLEAKFGHDAQAEFLSIQRRLDEEAEQRHAKLEHMRHTLVGLQLSAFGAGLEGQGGDVLTSALNTPKTANGGSRSLPSSTVLRGIADIKSITDRLSALLTDMSLERSTNHTALGTAMAVAAQRRAVA